MCALLAHGSEQEAGEAAQAPAPDDEQVGFRGSLGEHARGLSLDDFADNLYFV
jgi:hypothetical protein